MAAGACGALISKGPFTALRLLPGATCIRSPLSARFTVVCSTDGAAVVAVDDTSRPMRKEGDGEHRASAADEQS